MTLVDTSAWAEFLRGTGTEVDRAVARLLEQHDPVHTTDLVVAELLAGASDRGAAARIGALVASLDRCAPAGLQEAERAARLFRTCRDRGEQVPLGACMLAAVALRDDLDVLAADPAFEVLARHGGPALRGTVPGAGAASPPSPAPANVPSAPTSGHGPPASTSEHGPPASTSEPVHRTDILILVIEDEPGEVALITRALEESGMRTLTAGSAREARALLKSERPDAVVLDLVLPDEDGRVLLAELRRLPATRHAGVVVLSGRGGPRTRQECFALGANAFLTKPVETGDLPASVRGVLGRDRTGAPAPDPLTQPLSLREIHAAMDLLRTQTEQSPLAVGLIEIHAPDDEETTTAPVGFAAPGDPGARLAWMLRSAIAATVPLLDDPEILGRWSADELVVVSPSRSDTELASLIDTLAADPALKPHLAARVRLVGRDEDLLDAVSAMSAELAAGRPEEAVAVASPGRRARPVATLVEDDPITASLVRHRLERSGFMVRHHQDGAEAFVDIVAAPPDIAVLDVQLPSMDGFEILGRMKEHAAAAGVPVLVFTSLGRQEHVSRAFQLGADDYVTKPFSPSELLTRVLRLVRKR